MQEFPYPCCAVFFDFPDGSVVEGSICNARDTGDMGSITKVGTSPGEGINNPLQYSCLQNPMDRGAWQAAVQRVAESCT